MKNLSLYHEGLRSLRCRDPGLCHEELGSVKCRDMGLSHEGLSMPQVTKVERATVNCAFKASASVLPT